MSVTGELYDGTKLDGAADLRAALVSRFDVIATQLTERLLSYALGRRVEYYDMPAVRTIVRDAKAQDYRVSALVDPGSFQEIGALTGFASYDEDGRLAALAPANFVAGTARLDGRKVVIGADDPKRLTVGVPSLASGHYTVKFRVLSVDGHVVEGTFPFEVRARP